MASETKIQWCDKTFNPWIGCTKVAPGCANCYAEADMDTRRGRAKWGPKGTRSKTSAEYWKQPRKWNREAEKAGERFRVFCASLADVFEDWVGPIVDHNGKELRRCIECGFTGNTGEITGESHRCVDWFHAAGLTMADLRRDLFELIDATPHLDWLLVTKRPENIHRFWPVAGEGNYKRRGDGLDDLQPLRPNVWLLTSISDQETADKNVPELLKCRDLSPVLGVSAEPLLGPVDLRRVAFQRRTLPAEPATGVLANDWETLYGDALTGFRATSLYSGTEGNASLDWVIAGGESGPNARPCDGLWIKALVEQCSAANVPCFVKQLGSHVISRPVIKCARTVGKTRPDVDKLNKLTDELTERITFKHPKGGDPSEWPEDLRVRQFPHPTANGQ